MRKALIILVVLAFAGIVSAQPITYTGTVVVTLDIPVWSDVQWQDMNIVFGPNGQVAPEQGPGYDWWNTTAIEGSAYSSGNDPGLKTYATDPWSGDPTTTPAPSAKYWESGDWADIYVTSNGGMNLQITPSGDLTNGSFTLPSYFTAAAAWWDVGGFIANGTTYMGGWTAGVPPFGWNDGQYLSNVAGTDFGLESPSAVWPGLVNPFNEFPTQKAWVMAGSPTYTLAMNQYVRGTFTFHGRVERNGMSDPAGVYTANLNVTLSVP